MSTALIAQSAPEGWKQKFAKASDEYFDQVDFRYAPTNGTVAGYHQYDGQLEDFSRATIDKQISDLKAALVRIEEISAQSVEPGIAGKPSFEGHALLQAKFDRTGGLSALKVVEESRGFSDEAIELCKRQALSNLDKLKAVAQRRHENNAVMKCDVRLFPPELERQDLSIVEANIRSQLLTLEMIRPWEKNADNYSSACGNGAFTLMERKFASSDERLRSLTAREKQMPALLDAARVNLKNPPRIYTEIAIEQLPDIVTFFEHDVPLAFADAQDAALKAEFGRTNAAVVAALNSYLSWLKTDLLPRSNGDFRIGADAFQKKLAYDEMVDTPLDKLLEIGWADMRKNQAHFNEVAKELEPDKDARAVLEELGENHPAPDHLLDAFRATFDGLVSFIRAHHIVTIPSDVRPIVEETPPFMRATTFASMDTPGPFEQHATEAYFNVTLPDPKLKPEEVEGFMHSFNVGTVISTAVHEAYPGHYIQFLWLPQAPSKVRKLLGANTDIEGWAHYTEQMMLDEGYGQPGAGAKDDRESKFLRLGQLQDALLRNARFIVGIEMHTGKMSFDEAVAFFQKEGYQSKETAMVETKRGTSDPTYLYYTLGKLEIIKLREDVKKRDGAAFSLQKFHDDFLRQGSPPVKIVREAMLGDQSPTL